MPVKLMSRGEQEARRQLPDVYTSSLPQVTIQVGRWSYHFERWVDCFGRKKWWKRTPNPLDGEDPCKGCQERIRFQAQRNRREDVRCATCGTVNSFIISKRGSAALRPDGRVRIQDPLQDARGLAGDHR